jgi:hypothetical protein
MDTTTVAITVPRIGRGPAAEGRRAALRSFHAQMMTLDGDMLADLATVENGTAPQEFKDAFRDTLASLSDLFDTTTN